MICGTFLSCTFRFVLVPYSTSAPSYSYVDFALQLQQLTEYTSEVERIEGRVNTKKRGLTKKEEEKHEEKEECLLPWLVILLRTTPL